MLESYSFKNVLKRGYSIVWDKNKPISNTSDLKKLSIATIECADGKVDVFTTPNNTQKSKKDKKEAPQNLQGDLF